MFTAGIGGREFEDVFISSWATGCMSPVVKVVFVFFGGGGSSESVSRRTFLFVYSQLDVSPLWIFS